MKASLVFAATAVVVVIAVSGVFVLQQGASSGTGSQTTSTVSATSSGSSTVTTSTGSQSVTSTGSGGSVAGLQLQLSVKATSTPNPNSTVTVQIGVEEYNTLLTALNASKADGWAINGTSLGSCGMGAYPFGVALYKGTYDSANVSEATPLQIYPIVPCPLFLRLVTGYVFQPTSDLAVILPGNSTTQMSANETATATYNILAFGPSSTPLGQGTYTVAAADEWGALVVVHFTLGNGFSTSVTGTGAATAALEASRIR